MLTADELDRVSIVLVRARNPGNIGAVARAMHDFGFHRLRVVNDFPLPFEAARSAIDASSVLESATIHPSVADAVADCTLVLGTTAVGERDLQHRLLTLPEAAPEMHAALRHEGRVALLFGSEKTGLSNEELSHCHWLLTIPMYQHAETAIGAGRHLSMNLGQAVAVCLYELARDTSGSAAARAIPSHAAPLYAPHSAAASAGDQERLTSLLSEVLEATEYTRRHPANSGLPDLRRLTLRMGADATDAPVWMGILRQILWKLRL